MLNNLHEQECLLRCDALLTLNNQLAKPFVWNVFEGISIKECPSLLKFHSIYKVYKSNYIDGLFKTIDSSVERVERKKITSNGLFLWNR